uniref:Uncharacterized protein n=1 Tax=Cannabis sativa TaxID=3483 RepID=A0A803NL07_CANSA
MVKLSPLCTPIGSLVGDSSLIKVMFNPQILLSYFIDDNGCWNKDWLLEFFDHELVLAILVVPIGDPTLPDSLIWERHTSGSFTVNSAYHLAKFSASLPTSSDNHSFIRWWKAL